MPKDKSAKIGEMHPDDIKEILEAREEGRRNFEKMSPEERRQAGQDTLKKAAKALSNPSTKVG